MTNQELHCIAECIRADEKKEVMIVVRDNPDGTEKVIGEIIFNPLHSPFNIPLGIAEGAKHSVYSKEEFYPPQYPY